jgi:hypothetical protein
MRQINNNKIRFYKGKAFILAFLLFTFYLIPIWASAHRFHTSLTRMDYNSESKSLELTIQLFSHDIVETFEQKFKKKIDLDQTSKIDKLIFEYLKENFILKGKSGQTAKIKWVGKEAKVDLTWVYLEIPFTENLEGANLQNTIFFEMYQEQTNYVICRFEQKKADLFFKIGDKSKEIQVLGDTMK